MEPKEVIKFVERQERALRRKRAFSASITMTHYYGPLFTLNLFEYLVSWIKRAPMRHMAMLKSLSPYIDAERLQVELKDWVDNIGLAVGLKADVLEIFKDQVQKNDIHSALDTLLIHTAELKNQLDPQNQGLLENNLHLLKKGLGLSKADIRLLAFAILTDLPNSVKSLSREVNENLLTAEFDLHDLLAAICELTPDDVRQALSRKSLLRQSGLVEMEVDFLHSELDDVLDPLSSLHKLAHEHFDTLDALMSLWLNRQPDTTLSLKNFPHLETQIQEITEYLQQAVKLQVSGANVFLYGPPGTGKTELASLLAEQANMTLYTINDNPLDTPSARAREDKDKRLRTYRLAQSLLRQNHQAMILLDEAEDIFGSHNPLSALFGIRTRQTGDKHTLSQLLETNPVPTVWITNHIEQVDPAYLRRFSYLVEMNVPPRSIRRQIIDQHWQGLPVSDALKSHLAEQADIPPSIYAKAAQVIGMFAMDEKTCEQALLNQINSWRNAVGLPPVNMPAADMNLPYDVSLINTEPGATFLLRMLRNAAQARLCFYGAPGTGKSAFARHLSTTLDKPLMLRRVSDLISPYVGETERNLAKTFREAEREGAILFLDEGDSFLRNRTLAHHSWEVTQTNELLTQMEHFNGIFILATNLMDNLDPAALRRFDFQVQFNPMRPEQRWQLFHTIVPDADTTWQEKLHSLPLNLGHFATVWRQIKLVNIQPDAQFLFQLLKTHTESPKSG